MIDEKIIRLETGLTRRGFLKKVGLSALALTAGYAVGSLTGPRQVRTLVLQAFIPADAALAVDLATAFAQLAGPVGDVLVGGEAGWVDYLSAALSSARQPGAVGLLSLHTAPLQRPAPADLLLSDQRLAVYDPQHQFDPRFARLRRQMRGLPASLVLNAAVLTLPPRSSPALHALIRVGSAVIDRVPLDQDYKDIVVDGSLGKTHLSIKDGRLAVKQASCRQHFCQQVGFLAHPGDRTACAPNRLLVEIESG